MKWEHLTIASCFLTLLVARVVLLSPRHEINASSILAFRPGDDSNQSLPFAVLAAGDDPPAIQRSETWQKYTCRGQKLWQAMTNKKDKAVDYLTPIDTLFDGTLEEELERWGYIERNDDADDLCMFDTYLRQPLEALDIDPKGSVFGGPNECFFFQHYDPNMQDEDGFLVPSYNQEYEVDGKTYRVSDPMLYTFIPDADCRQLKLRQSLAPTQRVEWFTSSTSSLLLRAQRRLGG